ncbi:MAG: (Fe-S)-binding protein [Methanomassiliicoccales archaeon]|jgi:ArsR family metal-binding transcriptional regulator|nr:(Fe-S)-binding protein [Methanomassiliicoccales archaeon]
MGSFKWALVETLPCIADSRKIRAIYRIEGDIQSLLPYLASDRLGSSYNEGANVLSYKSKERIISIDGEGNVGITQLTDLDEAERVIKEVVDWIEDVKERKNEIDPEEYKKRKKVGIIDLLRLLPRSNCGKCGFPTCMAFAVEILEGRAQIESCQPLSQENYRSTREKIDSLLIQAGLKRDKR